MLFIVLESSRPLQNRPKSLPGPSLAKGRLRGSLGELGEGLEELRENLWELWEGAGGMKFGRFEIQNRESGVGRCISG